MSVPREGTESRRVRLTTIPMKSQEEKSATRLMIAVRVVLCTGLVGAVVGAYLDVLPGHSALPFTGRATSWAHDRRTGALQQEFTQLGPTHDWAGQYYRGRGLGGTSLFVAPDNGYAYTTAGCLGLYGFGGGSIAVTDRGLQFSARIGTRLPSELSSDLVPIRWGPKRLLLPRSEFDELVEDVTWGRVRRGSGPSWCFQRVGDGEFVPGTRPELPEPWNSRLDILDRKFLILEVLPSGDPIDEQDRTYRTTRVRLDAGRSQGIPDPKMVDGYSEEMPLVDNPRFVGCVAYITEVGDNHCFANVFSLRQHPAPQVGWSLVAPGMDVASEFWGE